MPAYLEEKGGGGRAPGACLLISISITSPTSAPSAHSPSVAVWESRSGPSAEGSTCSPSRREALAFSTGHSFSWAGWTLRVSPHCSLRGTRTCARHAAANVQTQTLAPGLCADPCVNVRSTPARRERGRPSRPAVTRGYPARYARGRPLSPPGGSPSREGSPQTPRTATPGRQVRVGWRRGW